MGYALTKGIVIIVCMVCMPLYPKFCINIIFCIKVSIVTWDQIFLGCHQQLFLWQIVVIVWLHEKQKKLIRFEFFLTRRRQTLLEGNYWKSHILINDRMYRMLSYQTK